MLGPFLSLVSSTTIARLQPNLRLGRKPLLCPNTPRSGWCQYYFTTLHWVGACPVLNFMLGQLCLNIHSTQWERAVCEASATRCCRVFFLCTCPLEWPGYHPYFFCPFLIFLFFICFSTKVTVVHMSIRDILCPENCHFRIIATNSRYVCGLPRFVFCFFLSGQSNVQLLLMVD